MKIRRHITNAGCETQNYELFVESLSHCHTKRSFVVLPDQNIVDDDPKASFCVSLELNVLW